MTTTIPAGWKLVPIEPTEAMLDAGIEQHRCEQGDPWYSSPDLGQGDCRDIYAAMLAAAPAAPVSMVEDADAQKEAVMDAIADALGHAYDCTRVWSAWGVGTMSQDDFHLVTDDAGRLGEIADAAIAAMRPAPVASAPADERALTAQQRKEFIRRTSYISEADRDTRAAFVDEIARAALASAPVAGEAQTALNEWFDKTDFIQKRIASGDLPVMYLGWHRADVMRDLIDAAARNQVLPSGCILVQEADTIPHTHPEYGPGIFFTEDARIEFDAAPQASEAADTLTIDLDYADGASVQIEVHGTERMLRRLEAWLGGERSRIREQSRNAALEEAATFLENNRTAWQSVRAAYEIRALKQPQAATGGGANTVNGKEFSEFANSENAGSGDCAMGAGDEAMRDALEMLIREAQAVADDHHRPRYTRLDEAIQSARAALSATQTEQGERDE